MVSAVLSWEHFPNIWCRNDLPQAYVDGRIVATREGGLQKTKPCAFSIWVLTTGLVYDTL